MLILSQILNPLDYAWVIDAADGSSLAQSAFIFFVFVVVVVVVVVAVVLDVSQEK